MGDDAPDDIDGFDAMAAQEDADYPPLSDRDKRRLARMEFTGEKYPNCRQRDISEDRCTAHKASRCPICRKCPVCGGTLLLTEREEVVDGEHIKKVDEMSCVQCGAWMERDIHQPVRVRNIRTEGDIPECSVGECLSRAWDHQTITIANQRFPVCDSHKRFHERWLRAGADPSKSHLATGKDGKLVRIPSRRESKLKRIVRRMSRSEAARLGGLAKYANQKEKEHE